MTVKVVAKVSELARVRELGRSRRASISRIAFCQKNFIESRRRRAMARVFSSITFYSFP